ncbi:3-phosphoshikimate 1-carboxyvinyltransferase [Fervidibacillus halotolerans]|uniref:3-phosphoshikimate 1-carboxyvinyltransferase n=2 Tax=Fervidibacillus halotolerans TaxID=2980027 RepID=A0A9E8M3V9_9BACI|nr:3-phosphoshikimate 1-carboxyvinyltransferase [Fervidibacillus halotolerans]WAA13914.1 3-phosphoshikimate 1-carboxyvinyltransferase [Fervidibacillus halotolerans]
MTVPGDKSISHRAVMFGALGEGLTEVTNFLNGDDCLRTVDAFRKLGVPIRAEADRLFIEGKGLAHFKEPTDILYVGNSGTTARLMLGILAGSSFYTVLSGDRSLNRRPMERVVKPLQKMGAEIIGRERGKYLPISIRGRRLKGIRYHLPVASAQLKSALIFAALHAEGDTMIVENAPSRNHTEIMLEQFGGQIEQHGKTLKIKGNQRLNGTNIHVPGDFSSASFFIALGAMVKKADLVIENIGLNPTRTGLLDVLKRMNGNFDIIEKYEKGEPRGSLRVRSSSLVATTIGGDLIPRLIDEIPIIALLATQAEGTTVIQDAKELRVKESNRISTVVGELKKLGAKIEATEDGMIIKGKTKLSGGYVDSHGDHRIGIMLAIASLLTDEQVVIENYECTNISYPNFFEQIKKIS